MARSELTPSSEARREEGDDHFWGHFLAPRPLAAEDVVQTPAPQTVFFLRSESFILRV